MIINEFILIMKWYGVWSAINFFLCCLISLKNGFNIKDTINFYNNRKIKFLTYNKNVVLPILYFYFLNMSLIINLIAIWFWLSEFIIELIIIIITFPYISDKLINDTILKNLYFDTTKHLKKIIGKIFAHYLCLILNFTYSNILELNENENNLIEESHIYEYIKKIDYSKIILIIKDIIFCYFIVYISSYNIFNLLNSKTFYSEEKLKKLFNEKNIDKLISAKGIYSILNIYNSNKKNKLKIIMLSKIESINNCIIVYNTIWSLGIFINDIGFYGNMIALIIAILFKVLFFRLDIETIVIPIILKNYINTMSLPLLILIIWIFKFNYLPINYNINFLYCVGCIFIGIIIKTFLFYPFDNLIYLVFWFIIFYTAIKKKERDLLIYSLINVLCITSKLNLFHILMSNLYIYYLIEILLRKDKIKINVIQNYFNSETIKKIPSMNFLVDILNNENDNTTTKKN